MTLVGDGGEPWEDDGEVALDLVKEFELRVLPTDNHRQSMEKTCRAIFLAAADLRDIARELIPLRKN